MKLLSTQILQANIRRKTYQAFFPTALIIIIIVIFSFCPRPQLKRLQLPLSRFSLARDPTAAALADPYLGQSIGPVPGYGVSVSSLYRAFPRDGGSDQCRKNAPGAVPPEHPVLVFIFASFCFVSMMVAILVWDAVFVDLKL